jgi:hypothetical protein
MQGAWVFRQTLSEQGWRIVNAQLTQYRRRFYATWMLDLYHRTDGGRPCTQNEFLNSP